MEFLKKILGTGGGEKKSSAPDPGKLSDKRIAVLIDAYLKENPDPDHDVCKSVSGQAILNLDRDQQTQFTLALISALHESDAKANGFVAKLPTEHERINVHRVPGWAGLWTPRRVLYKMFSALLARKPPIGVAGATAIARWFTQGRGLSSYHYPINPFASQVEELARKDELNVELREALAKVLALARAWSHDSEIRKFGDRIETAIGGSAKIPIRAGEVWSDAALRDLDALSPAKKTAWAELLQLCQSASGAQPSAKWMKSAKKLLENFIPEDEFKGTIGRWFPLVDKPLPDPGLTPGGRPVPPLYICELHADILRGLVWICGLFGDKETARSVTALALSAYKKIPGHGPRLVKVGNACIQALGAMPGMEGVGNLALLRVKVKFGTAQKMLDKALGVAAQRLGLPMEELEEMGVPAYGMTEVGGATFTFGDFTAELRIPDSKTTQIVWKNTAGKIHKSPPTKVKTDFVEDFKELKATEKDIQKMLPAQVERIDQLYLQQKEWPLEVWRERYLNHPLVGVIARTLIWRFRKGTEISDRIWKGGALVDRQGRDLELPVGTVVTLWHPLQARQEDILAWRVWLEENQIRQPFKQAHREIYLLTPAEENTGTYSNRFAAHVLKQHQFNALAAARGWKNKLRLMVDDTYPPAYVLLPKWNLRAEYWIEGAGTEYGQDTNDAGTYLYLITDQVRFYPIDASQRHAHAGGGGYAPERGNADGDRPLELSQIPPLVFSEVMRDVDLFVGVASVGNDPNWNDGGPRGRYVDYWQKMSFGELSASAQTRKAILERLIPRLKIAQQCSFVDKFLVVSGQVRTYKIHLGSGNILMSPNDQYLCIVQGRSVAASDSDAKVFLPFEGDNVMAVILSKAFLLAADSKIKDATILRQIKPA